MKTLHLARLATLALVFIGGSATTFAQTGHASVQQDGSSLLHATVDRLEARVASDPALYQELFELVRKNPELMARIPQYLRGDTVDSDTSDTLIFCLEDLGSPEAQRVLASIQVNPEHRALDRMRAVMALGAVAEPTAQTLQSLWGVALQRDEPARVSLSNVALLALGTAGSTMRHFESPDYAEVRHGLINTVHLAQDPSERAMALKAVGNLHDPTLADDVAAYLMATSAPVRATAAQALAMLGDASRVPDIAGQLRTEPHGAVRAAMTEALRGLPADEDALRVVLSMTPNERNDEARASMVRYLVENLKSFEEARAVLRELTFNDPSNRIRVLASSALRG